MWPFRKKIGGQPPPLEDPPDWMVQEVRRRTQCPLPVCREILLRATIDQYKRIVAAQTPAEYEALCTGTTTDDGDFQHDPIEDDPAFAAVLLRATLEAEREVGANGEIGNCFVFWDCKKRILKRYGVLWRDEAELNPDWEFD